MLAQTDLLPVAFRGDELFLVDHAGEPYVPMRPVAEGMGLDWKSQHMKLVTDRDRFSVVEITTQMPGDDQRRAVVCLPLRRLFGWLMTISPNKVKPALRERIIRYQRECDEILWRHWVRREEWESRQGLGVMLDLTRERLGCSAAAINTALVLRWLAANCADRKEYAFSVREIGAEAQVSKSSVARALAALSGWGLVQWVTDGPGNSPGRVRLLRGKLDQALGWEGRPVPPRRIARSAAGRGGRA